MFTASKLVGAATKGVLGFMATAVINKGVDMIVCNFDPNAIGKVVLKAKEKLHF